MTDNPARGFHGRILPAGAHVEIAHQDGTWTVTTTEAALAKENPQLKGMIRARQGDLEAAFPAGSVTAVDLGGRHRC